MQLKKQAVAAMTALALAALGVGAIAGQEIAAEITVQGEGTGVSSIAYDSASSRILVGALGEAAVYSINASGALTPVVEDEAITAGLSMAIDSVRGRLLVVNTSAPAGFDPANMQLPEGMTLPEGFDPSNMQMPPGFDPSTFDPSQLPEGVTLPEGFDPSQFQAQMQTMMGSVTIGLLVYDLASGAQTLNVDLTAVAPTGGRLPSAIALDADGNAYITDRAAGVIYRVDPAGSAAYLTDSRFTGENGMGLTGIAYHPNGYLLVSKSDGSLYKIPLDNPTNVQPVTADAVTAISALALLTDGRVVTLDAQGGTLTVLTSADDWATATASGSTPAPENAATLTTDGTSVYVVTGGFGMGMMGGMMQDGTAPILPAPVITQIGF